jgi:hypothetical protein
MKGMSTVIATVLMMMITVAMAGLAYMYIGNTLGPSALPLSKACETDCYKKGFDYIRYDGGGTCTCGRCANVTIGGFPFKECVHNVTFTLIDNDR